MLSNDSLIGWLLIAGLTVLCFQVAWLKVRNLTLRILAASVMLGREIDHDHQTNNGLLTDGKKPMHSVLQDLHKQLTRHIHSCQDCYTQEYMVIYTCNMMYHHHQHHQHAACIIIHSTPHFMCVG